MFASSSDSSDADSSVGTIGGVNSVLARLHYSDRTRVEQRANRLVRRLYPDADDTKVEVEMDGREESLKREDSGTLQQRQMSAADFLPSLPSFGRKKGPSADDSAKVLARLESEYINAEDGEQARTVAVYPEAGSYPMHMHRDYLTPVYVESDQDGGDASTGGSASPLLPPGRGGMRPRIVSHDVLMLILSYVSPHLPTLVAVGSVCRAWRERTEYLSPHWDLVGNDDRLQSYYSRQRIAFSGEVEVDPEAVMDDSSSSSSHTSLIRAEGEGAGTREDGAAAVHSRTPSEIEAIAQVAESIRAEEAPQTASPDVPISDANSTTSTSSGNEPAASSSAAANRSSKKRLFKLRTACRREYIIHHIKDTYCLKEGISVLYMRQRLLGLFPFIVYAIWMAFAAAVAFAMGYLPNALDTDVKIGVTYIFGIVSVSGLAQGIAEYGFCLRDSGYQVNIAYSPKSQFSAYRSWALMSTGIIFLVVGLLAHRLAAADRFLDEQSFDANGVWANDSSVSRYCPVDTSTTAAIPPFPPAVDFSPLSVGTSNYSWISSHPLLVSFAYSCVIPGSGPTSTSTTTNCSHNFTVLVAAYSDSLLTGCSGGTNPARFIAFEVGTEVSDTLALGDRDPLTYFAGGGSVHTGNTADHDGIQIKVPRSNKLFPIWDDSYSNSYVDYWYTESLSDIATDASVTYIWSETPNGSPGGRNYDAATTLSGMPWSNHSIPLVPYFGRGGVQELINAYRAANGGTPTTSGVTYKFQSYNDLRDELILGIWVLIGTAFGCLFLLYLSLWCYRFKRTNKGSQVGYHCCNGMFNGTRIILLIIVYLMCNPVMMLGFGTCYFKDPMPSYCMMSYDSALALFIVGLVFSCCCCLAVCGLTAKIMTS